MDTLTGSLGQVLWRPAQKNWQQLEAETAWRLWKLRQGSSLGPSCLALSALALSSPKNQLMRRDCQLKTTLQVCSYHCRPNRQHRRHVLSPL